MQEVELTPEEIAENLKVERKEKYKNTQHFLISEDSKKLFAEFVEKGDAMIEEIKAEIEARKEGKKTEAIHGEMDKIVAFIDFLEEVLAKLGNSAGEEVYKEIIKGQIEAGWTHIYNKIEELGDVPVYSGLDFLKQKRIDCLLLNKRFENWSAMFQDQKEEKMDLDPYED